MDIETTATRAISISVVMLLIVVLIAGLALGIILISRMLYRHHLDRVVAGKEHGVHSKMVDPISVAKVVFAAIAMIWMGASMIYISQLKTQLEMARLELENQIGMVDKSIADLQSKLQEAKSLFEEYDYEIQSIDPEKKTADVLFRVVPKTVDANATIKASWGTYSVELKEEGGTYRGVMTVPVFEKVEENPVITIQNGNIKETEIMENSLYSSISDYCFDEPMVELPNIINWDASGKKIGITGHTYFAGKWMRVIPGIKGTKVDLVVRSGNKELDRIPVPYDFTAMGESELEINKEYTFVDDKIEILAEVTTEGGWTVSSMIMYIGKTEEEVVHTSGMFEIRDKDGTLLYSTGNPISWSETSEENGEGA